MGELPKNWKEKKIIDYCDVISGSTPKTNISKYWNGDILWITPKDLSGYKNKFIDKTSRTITQKGYNSCSTRLIPPNSVLMSSRAPIGYLVINKKPICTNQGFKSFNIIDKNVLNEEFLYYQLKLNVEKIKNTGSGTTFNEISKTKAENIMIRVPSYKEQELIIQEIETQFTRLDATVKALNSIRRKFDVYRKSVLEFGIRGELNALSSNDWNETNLSHISEIIGGYAFKSKTMSDSGNFQIVKIANVKNGTLKLESRPSFINNVDEDIIQKYQIIKDDIVITLTGTRGKRDYGFVSLVLTNSNLLLNQRLARIKLTKKTNPKYVELALRSVPVQDQFFKGETGIVGQGNISMKTIQNLCFKLPKYNEQNDIVDEIESRFSVIDKLEETINKALIKAEQLRKSILKFAFEGKLVKYEGNN